MPDWNKYAQYNNPMFGMPTRFGSQQQEQQFQDWYKQFRNDNPDDPDQHYDYRSAWLGGAGPSMNTAVNEVHWPSQYKANDHPNRFIVWNGDLIDTVTDEKIDNPFIISLLMNKLKKQADSVGIPAENDN